MTTTTGAYVVKYQPHRTRTDVGGWILGSRWTGKVIERYATRAEAEAALAEVVESLAKARQILGEVA